MYPISSRIILLVTRCILFIGCLRDTTVHTQNNDMKDFFSVLTYSKWLKNWTYFTYFESFSTIKMDTIIFFALYAWKIILWLMEKFYCSISSYKFKVETRYTLFLTKNIWLQVMCVTQQVAITCVFLYKVKLITQKLCFIPVYLILWKIIYCGWWWNFILTFIL